MARLTTYPEFALCHEFLQEGYEELFRADGANMQDLTPERLFSAFLELAVYPDKGFLGILTNKNDVLLGFVAAHDTTKLFTDKELTLFAVYSNKKCPTAVKEMIHELKEWASENGYKKIRACSFKKSGASQYLHTKILGMRYIGLHYEIVL